MQMRKMLYQSTDKRVQAQEYRQAAEECERAGFLDLAQVNFQMAWLLDPPVEETYEAW